MLTLNELVDIFLFLSYTVTGGNKYRRDNNKLEILTLDRLKKNESAFIERIDADKSIKRRLYDLGLTRGTNIKCVGMSPLGDPCAYLVRGAVIAIRHSEGKNIILVR